PMPIPPVNPRIFIASSDPQLQTAVVPHQPAALRRTRRGSREPPGAVAFLGPRRHGGRRPGPPTAVASLAARRRCRLPRVSMAPAIDQDPAEHVRPCPAASYLPPARVLRALRSALPIR